MVIGGNNFVGDIPTEIGSMRQLHVLDVRK